MQCLCVMCTSAWMCVYGMGQLVYGPAEIMYSSFGTFQMCSCDEVFEENSDKPDRCPYDTQQLSGMPGAFDKQEGKHIPHSITTLKLHASQCDGLLKTAKIMTIHDTTIPSHPRVASLVALKPHTCFMFLHGPGCYLTLYCKWSRALLAHFLTPTCIYTFSSLTLGLAT